MAARGLLFDLDGTLWDSHPVYEAALGAAGAGVAQRLRRGANLVGLVSGIGIPKATFAQRCAARAEDALYPRVVETLGELESRGTAMAVVTNLPGWLVTPVLGASGLAGFFSDVRTAAGKPRPHALVAAANALSPRPSFLVGDGVADATAAARASIGFAWVAYGYFDEPPEGTSRILRGFEEVLEL